MKAAFKAWLPLAVLATLMAGIICLVTHQTLRQSANDPQVQMAEDWVDQIVGGTDPNRLNLGPFIDPARSLSPFGIVYNQDGNIIASSVSAPSTMTQPSGVFDTVDAAAAKQATYTWQPASGERYAVVLKRASLQDKSYYVLAGRNLKQVESRAMRLIWQIAAGWAITLVAIAVTQNLHLVGHLVRRKNIR
ncbi:MAG TPA: hypothetical protein VM581_01915 [Magnetospirillaceae bacterium]|nr:hypothetical protein [Magnetospirillaceae bacterium]